MMVDQTETTSPDVVEAQAPPLTGPVEPVETGAGDNVSADATASAAPTIDYSKKESELPSLSSPEGTDAIAPGPSPSEAVASAISKGAAPKRPVGTGTKGRGNGGEPGGRGGGGANQYLNPKRHLTGGPAREKLSQQELEAKMERARLQNEAILKRRELVERDKDNYSALTEKERKERKERARKVVEDKKIQLAIDEERNKNRERKLEKVDRRLWDSEKAGNDALWQTNYKEYTRPVYPERGGRGGARGRGRGRGGAAPAAGAAAAQRKSSQTVDIKDEDLFPALTPARRGQNQTEGKEQQGASSTNQEVKAEADLGSNVTEAKAE
ncbi:hypothetical protein ACQY0O_005058 [Thecaphora frezii]